MSTLERNVAGQVWRVFAFNETTNAPVTGDAANITATIAKDGGTDTATNDVNPTEKTNGWYQFDLTQAESNAAQLDLIPVSSTANIAVVGSPASRDTVPAGFSEGTGAVDASASWDALQAAHTVADSFGAAVTDIRVKTDHGAWAVYFSAGGTAGGAGTLDDPISDETNALARVAELKTQILVIMDGTFTLPAGQNMDNLDVGASGLDSILDMNGESVSAARFEGLVLRGQQGGTNEITVNACLIEAVTNFNGTAINCIVSGITTIGTRGVAYFDNCQPLDGGLPPTIDYKNSTQAITGIVGWKGPLIMSGLGTNDPLTNINLNGVLTFDATNKNNNTPVVISGSGSIIDNSGGGFDIDSSQFLGVVNGNAQSDVQAWGGLAVAAMVEDTGPYRRFTSNALEQVLGSSPLADLTAVPGDVPTYGEQIQFSYVGALDGGTQSVGPGATKTVRNGSGVTIGTAPVTDTGTLFTRGKFV